MKQSTLTYSIFLWRPRFCHDRQSQRTFCKIPRDFNQYKNKKGRQGYAAYRRADLLKDNQCAYYFQ